MKRVEQTKKDIYFERNVDRVMWKVDYLTDTKTPKRTRFVQSFLAQSVLLSYFVLVSGYSFYLSYVELFKRIMKSYILDQMCRYAVRQVFE